MEKKSTPVTVAIVFLAFVLFCMGGEIAALKNRTDTLASQIDKTETDVGLLFYVTENMVEIKTSGPRLYEVTAYCPCGKCCGKWAKIYPRKTASGHVIKTGDRFVAAPKEIPFGTMIDIPGYGYVPVLDRGGAIKNGKLDVYFDTHEAALEWGRQYLTVTIVERPEQ